MDQLDAITLLYLSKNWDGKGTLLDCAHVFQQTKADLSEVLKEERDDNFTQPFADGRFSM